MAEDYARACGVPREVVIGGRAFFVGKLSPRDIGTLQAWFKSVLVDPRVQARERLRADPDMDDALARQIWTESAVAALDWPPDLGSEIGVTLLSSVEGQARLLHTAACRAEPSLTLDLCRAAAGVMTAEDQLHLWELVSPGELGDVIDPDSTGPSPSYAEIRATLCEKYTGWTFEYVDGLSFEAIRSAWLGGKEPKGVPVEDADDAAHVDRNWRLYVRGL
ncbi:MAG: hypothetical protein P4L84_02240 [Isosphaeraceae bacterium]|nr:hypothetical protein [Isosphaeraceae bacterium]